MANRKPVPKSKTARAVVPVDTLYNVDSLALTDQQANLLREAFRRMQTAKIQHGEAVLMMQTLLSSMQTCHNAFQETLKAVGIQVGIGPPEAGKWELDIDTMVFNRSNS